MRPPGLATGRLAHDAAVNQTAEQTQRRLLGYIEVMREVCCRQDRGPERGTAGINDLATSRLSEIHAGAINLFRRAAEVYMKTRIEEERAKAIDSSILGRVEEMARQVERATSFRALSLPLPASCLSRCGAWQPSARFRGALCSPARRSSL